MTGVRKAGVQVARNDAPAADFYMERAPWVPEAACLRERVPNEAFYEDTEGDERTDAIEHVQAVCARCPLAVRKQCGAEIMRIEGDASEDSRFGFRAYMTPAQRASIARRGGLQGRDPLKVVKGTGRRATPVVPLEGDRWSRHHTTLARKVVRWVSENVDVGDKLPTQTYLCGQLSCNPIPLRRVMDALVADGTLDFEGRKPGRGRNGLSVAYVRRGTPRAVASWLPPHLRTT